MSSEASGFKNVVADVTPGVEGAWVEMIASTNFASTWMTVHVGSEGGQDKMEFDVGTGAMGSEVEVISDQHHHGRNNSGGSGRGNWYSFPMTIPAGTRLSMRQKDSTTVSAVKACTLTISNFNPSNNVPSVAQSSGAKLVLSGGLDTYGSWVELISAINAPVVWMCVSVFNRLFGDEAEFDIGVGAAGLEVPVVEDIAWLKTFGNDGVTYSMGAYFPIEIAAGLRLAVRVKDNDASIRTYNCGVVVF